MSSDFNLEKLNTLELEKHIEATIEADGNIAIFGRRGIGKTQIPKQVIKALGKKELYVNLSVMERPDFGGFPDLMNRNNKSKYIDYILPSFYKSLMEDDEDVVLLLDEMDKADPSVWAPLLELTQFHSVNGNKLKNLKAIIMTGNLISEGGNRPCLPLLDRAEKYLIEPDATAWMNWAGKTGKIHPSIIAYINDYPIDLTGAVDAEDRYADQSPRGWERASDLLFKGEKNSWSLDVLSKKVSGCVGKEIGLKYSSYYEHYQVLLPLINKMYRGVDISKEFNSLEPTKQLVGSMIICGKFASKLDSKQCQDDDIINVANFFKKIGYENALVAIRTQIQWQRMIKYNIDQHPSWKPLLEEINKELSS